MSPEEKIEGLAPRLAAAARRAAEARRIEVQTMVDMNRIVAEQDSAISVPIVPCVMAQVARPRGVLGR